MKISVTKQQKQPQPSKEELEERVQARAHKQRLRRLREEDTCPEYDNEDIE